METDEYLTISASSEGIYKEKGSKFLAFALPVQSEEEVKKQLEHLRNQYHDARHHCYAYRLGSDMDLYRMNDDGEPSSTAGKPIFGQIKSKNLTDVLVVVVRYFGGTLLGASGLIRAYKSAAGDALKKAKIINKTVQSFYEIQFEYPMMNEVEKMMHDFDIRPYDKKFGKNCIFRLGIRKTKEEKMVEHLTRISELKYTKIEDP